MKSLRRWCLRDAGDIACRSWNDESVVYCDSQAATHLLGPVGGAVLAALRTRDEPQTIAEISIRAFGDDSSHILPREAADAVQDALREFERIGLVDNESP